VIFLLVIRIDSLLEYDVENHQMNLSVEFYPYGVECHFDLHDEMGMGQGEVLTQPSQPYF
jgi:hypothetical protein